MKLYLNKASPYARLALVIAHEKDLAQSLELVWIDPWASSEALLAVSPLSRVPVLVTDDGVAIADSTCICDYLDLSGSARALLPALPARAAVLRKYGLGRGAIELAFGATMEKRYHEGEKQPLRERWMATLAREARELEAEADALSADSPDLGDLAIAVGLSYVDFRLPEIGWRAESPKLAAWLDAMSARPSMRSTAPE